MKKLKCYMINCLNISSRNVIYLFCFFFCLPSKQLLGVSEACSKLTIKTPERLQWHRSGFFIVNFVNLSYLLRSVSNVNIEQVIACNSESHATLTKSFGAWLLYGHGLPQVWEKLKLKYFLRNGRKMEKVTSDGCLFSTREYVFLSKIELDR